jgi:hypothetical protein
VSNHPTIEDGYVFLVYSTLKEKPFLLSAHTTWEKAVSARAAYIADETFGDSPDHYWVHSVRLDVTGVKEK